MIYSLLPLQNESIHASELFRKAAEKHITDNTVTRYLKKFEKEGLVKRNEIKSGGRKFVTYSALAQPQNVLNYKEMEQRFLELNAVLELASVNGYDQKRIEKVLGDFTVFQVEIILAAVSQLMYSASAITDQEAAEAFILMYLNGYIFKTISLMVTYLKRIEGPLYTKILQDSLYKVSMAHVSKLKRRYKNFEEVDENTKKT